MRVAVIGGNGQLGTDVCLAFRKAGDVVRCLTHADVDVSRRETLHAVFADFCPELIVNTAALHNVEKCESEPQAAMEINAIGARNLAAFARESGAMLAHISTDYVFDGRQTRPYVEGDLPLPRSVYGVSKLAGEHFVRTIAPKHFVLRVSAIYGSSPCRGKGGFNFVTRMLNLATNGAPIRVVDDEFVTPTPTPQIARQLVVLSRSDKYGLYHATCEGSCSWYEFARAIFELSHLRPRLEAAKSRHFPSKVERPSSSVLENEALKRAGMNVFTEWRHALREFMAQDEVSDKALAV